MKPAPAFLLSAIAVLCVAVIGLSISLDRSDAERSAARQASLQSAEEGRRAAEHAERKRWAQEREALASEERNRREMERLEDLLHVARAEAIAANARVRDLTESLRSATQHTSDLERLSDGLRAELLAADDRLEKAYRDIAEMEKQLVELSRPWREGLPTLPPEPENVPKIDGTVLGVSDKVNLILISVGSKDGVQVGFKFTVHRDSKYVSKLIVDKVEEGWSACREITDFRKETIEQGDKVATRVFD